MTSFKNSVGKVVIIGDCAVGKTTFLRTYSTSGFEYGEKYSMTMGVVPSISEIRINDGSDAVQLLFYDTTGSDVYYEVLPLYWEAPDIALIVYDVSSATSFVNLNHWVELIKNIKWNSAAKDQPITITMFANKTDLIDRRVISTEMGKKFAEQYKINYFEGSAKTNEGVNEVFQWLARRWFSEIHPNNTNLSSITSSF